MRTAAVTTRTTLLLLRVRMHIDVTRGETTEALLAEEAVVAGYRGRGETVEWLSPEEAERLLDAEPAANIPRQQAIMWLEQSPADLPNRQSEIAALADARAEAALAAHRRVRDAANMTGTLPGARVAAARRAGVVCLHAGRRSSRVNVFLTKE